MKLEQRLRGQKAANRVRMLRLLTSGAVTSIKDCAPLIGYSVGQLTRWWECYRAAGLAALFKQHKPVGQTSKLTPEAWEGLMAAMRAGHIATMRSGARLSGARVGHPLQERQVALVALGRSIGSSGRLDAGGTRKPMPNNRPLFKKLRQPGQATSVEAGGGFR